LRGFGLLLIVGGRNKTKGGKRARLPEREVQKPEKVEKWSGVISKKKGKRKQR